MNWQSNRKVLRILGDTDFPVPVSFRVPALLAFVVLSWTASAAGIPGAAQFRKDIQPILSEFCYDCHADGANKGGVAFDEFKSDQALLKDCLLYTSDAADE